MGRPPIGKVAMTGAERTRLYRLKHSPVTKPVTKPAGGFSREELVQELTMLVGENAAQRAEIEQLRKAAATAKAATAKAAKAEPGPTWDELLMEQRENSRLQKRVHDLEKALGAKPKAEKAPLPPDEVRERRIKALTTQVRNLKQLVSMHEQHYAEAVAKVGGLPRSTKIAVDKVLHPDTRGHATEADKDEASQLWNAWNSTRRR
jgi:cell division septum initiation protein DivIVA